MQINLYSAPKKEPDVVYIGLNDRDPAWHDLYKLRLSARLKEIAVDPKTVTLTAKPAPQGDVDRIP